MGNDRIIDFELGKLINDQYFISALNIIAPRLNILIRNFENFNINQAGILGAWIH